MHTKENKTVSAKLVARLVDNLIHLDCNWETITKYTGIYPEEIQNSNRRFDGEKHYKLMTLLHNKDRDMDWFLDTTNFKFQLFFNRDNVIESLANDCANFTFLCLNSESLNCALSLYIKYRGLIANTDRISLQRFDDGISLTFFHEYPDRLYQFVPVINFIFIISLIEQYLTSSLTLPRYKIKSKSTKNCTLDAIYRYWNCDVEWEADVDTLTFQHPDIDTPYMYFNPKLYEILYQKVDNEYNRIFEVVSMSKLVENAINEMINHQERAFKGSLVIERICNRLGISKTTLARRLKEENTSYKEIEKRVKLEEGINMLRNTRTPISDISFNLGFSCQAAFNRFFNDQMQISPLKFRKSNTTN